MIGNAEDARMAVMAYRNGDMHNIFSRDGSTRDVYLINGVLYKVENGGLIGINADEYDYINNMRDSLPSGVHFPDTALYRILGEDVIATDRIIGQLKYKCYDQEIGDECDDFCLSDQEIEMLTGYSQDMSGFNTIVNDDGYWIIDCL